MTENQDKALEQNAQVESMQAADGQAGDELSDEQLDSVSGGQDYLGTRTGGPITFFRR